MFLGKSVLARRDQGPERGVLRGSWGRALPSGPRQPGLCRDSSSGTPGAERCFLLLNPFLSTPLQSGLCL